MGKYSQMEEDQGRRKGFKIMRWGRCMIEALKNVNTEFKT